jgi:Ca-activated chloride channel family protein
MSGHPIEMLKASCRAIASSLRSGDIVSMVTWDTSNNVVLSGHAVSGPDDATLLQRIASIEAGGGTDLHGGLTAGYELALQSFSADRINRIVLISDGGANTGVTDIDIIAEHAGGNGEDGIYMVGVGVGTAETYEDTLMDDVTDAGKGASVFINSAAEAERIFGTDFVNAMAVSARDVQVRLDLPPGFEILRFSGEEFSANPEEVEPQHISPNDAMVFHQKIGTCAPDLVDDTTTLTVTVRYKDAITFEEREVAVEVAFAELLATVDPRLLEGAAVFEYAEALKQYKKADYVVADQQAALVPALEALARAEEVLPQDPDLAEIRAVLDALTE